MNFTAVRGYNAYTQFTAKIREAAKGRDEGAAVSESEQRNSISIFGEPVDVVTISKEARGASAKLALIRENFSKKALEAPQKDPEPEYSEFRELLQTPSPSGLVASSFTQTVSGEELNNALAGSGISVDKDEEFDVSVKTLSAVTVASKNAEKAKAVQDLLNSTPFGINWGLFLATLPPR